MRVSEDRYRSLVEQAADAIWLVDQQGNFLLVNSRACNMLGYTREEFQHFNLRDLLTPEEQVSNPIPWDEIRAGKRVTRERLLRRKDGSLVPVETAAKMLANGNVQTIIRDVTERKQAEEQVQHSLEQLRTLAARLQSVREEERTRIAREIHDELGQALTGLKMDLSWMEKRVAPTSDVVLHGLLSPKMQAMTQLIDATIHTVRRIATELRPGVLDNLGLLAALEWQAQDFQNRADIPCHLKTTLEEIDIAQEGATAVFRIFQEILTNVVRHAHATRVDVCIAKDDGNLIIEVRDDGRGISESETTVETSIGLLGMRERALLLGGEVTIEGAPQGGTTVTVRMPVARETP